MTRRTSGFIAIALSTMFAFACGSREREGRAATPAPISVTATAVVAADVAERLEVGGVVTARQTAAISSRILAPILAVRVTAGDVVRAGDVVVTLDARDVAAQARQATASVAAAEHALAQAQTDQAAAEAEHKLASAWHGRIASLRERNSATAQELDEAEARLSGAAARLTGTQTRIDQAAANLLAARASAEAAATTESFAVLHAPFAGVVTERLTDPGNLATPGAPLLRIDAAGARRVEARVDEARADSIHPGDRVEVLIDRRDPRDATSPVVAATVAEVARAVSVDDRAFTVKIDLPATENPRTGTFARVLFRGAIRRVLLIPTEAVRRNGQVASVFVVHDGVARLRLVRAGASMTEGTEVLTGLDEGEMVVTSAPGALADGHPVTIAPGRVANGARR